ncbi:MAG: hypothetical protein ACKO4Z_03890 [Planctomycetota bacterium]
MQLDELKQSWAAHGAVLERSLAIDERLLREVLLRKVRFAMAPYLLWRALEVAICIAVLVAVVAVLGAHIAEPRYFVVAGTVAVFSFVITALNGYLLVSGLRLDYEGPVTAIRRDVERIKLAEYRAFKWALLGGVMLWLPVLLVLFEALTSVAALARVNLAYLVANLVFGLAVLTLGQMLSRRYVERPDIGPRTRRLVEAISGRALRTAAGNLADLARFEREDESETA